MIGVPTCHHFVYTTAEIDKTAGYQVVAKSSGIDDALLSLMDGYIYPAGANPAVFKESRSLLVTKDRIAYSMVKNVGVGHDGRDGTLYNHTLVMNVEDFSCLGYDTRVLEKYFVDDYSITGDLDPITVSEQTIKPDLEYLKNLGPLLESALYGIEKNANMAIATPDLKLIPNVLSVVPKHDRLRSFSTYVVQPARQPKYKIIQVPRMELKFLPKYLKTSNTIAPNVRHAVSTNKRIQSIIGAINRGADADVASLLDCLEKSHKLYPKTRADFKDESPNQPPQIFAIMKDMLAVHVCINDLVDSVANRRFSTMTKTQESEPWSRKKQTMRKRIAHLHKNIGSALRSNDPSMKKSNKKLLMKTLQAANDSLRHIDQRAEPKAPRTVHGPFSVRSYDIYPLSPHDCVRLFGDLLACDAWRLKVPISEIQFTDKTMPDGGIDARVGRVALDGHVLHGNHSYQIKAGENFSPWQKSAIKKEMLKDTAVLKPEILQCFQDDDTYVLVCMQKRLTPQQIGKSVKCIKSVVKSCGIKDPKVKVWGQDVITDTASQFPSIRARFRDYGGLQTHSQWSNDPDMKKPLTDDRKQAETIEKIRARIGSYDRHVDVCGDIGMGKTRMVLEATRTRDLSPLVVYCPSPDDLQHILQHVTDEKLPCILVVDGCDYASGQKIASNLASVETARLVTTSTKCHGDSMQVVAPALDGETIKKIMRGYADDNITAGRLSDWCEGIPMMAHLFGQALASGQDLLRGPQDKHEVFDMYMKQDGPDPTRLDQRRRVLFTISLFQKFDSSSGFQSELDCVCKIVQRIDGNITNAIFQEHVSELRDLGILRGGDTLRLSPRPLHVWMWTQWWKLYRQTFDLQMFQDMPPSLQDGFIHMLEYSQSSEHASCMLKDLFKGELSDPRRLTTYPGHALFPCWARADPVGALRHLEGALRTATNQAATSPEDPDPIRALAARADPDELMSGVASLASSLETIAFRGKLFVRAARLLLRLAESFPESQAASSVVHLFSLGIAQISPTQARPRTRLPVLKEMLSSEKPALRDLGIRACETALSVPYSRLVSPGNDFVKDEFGWVPETWRELEDAYKTVIDTMMEKMTEFSAERRLECASIIAQRAMGITGLVPPLAGYLADTLSALVDIVGKKKTIQITTDIVGVMGKKMPSDSVRKFQRLLADLTGTSYFGRLERFAGMDINDPASDDHGAARMRELETLAGESDAGKLGPELGWLVAKESNGARMFGAALAERDEEFALLPRILEAQRAAGSGGVALFLAGYMSVVREADCKEWRRIMHLVPEDDRLVHLTVELYWRSGRLDDDGALHLLDLVRSGKIDASRLAVFVMGSKSRGLSDGVVLEWIEHMSGTGDPNAVAGALELFYSHFVQRSKRLAYPEIAVDLLLHDAFLSERRDVPIGPMVEYYWTEIASKLTDHAQLSLNFASSILCNMDKLMKTRRPAIVRVLKSIGSDRPDDLWDLVTKHVAVPFDDKSSEISAWLSVHDLSAEFMDGVDFKKISRWIDRGPDDLAPLVAMWVRPVITKTSAARKILARYGSDPRVQDALSANFFTGVFSGPESLHLEEKKKALADYKGRDDEHVVAWIDRMIEELDYQIARAKREGR